ncbi:hypothetical protein M426DRAFT_67072 [Hypoxylon sp. CI-4A]|nr:hypothetical protein M426DRAFT_67072 [Hypoxylon sp. CI-4A]
MPGIKSVPISQPKESNASPKIGRGGHRATRIVPFSSETFQLISDRFYMHGSIAKVVNRSDVPTFSRAKSQMSSSGGPSYPVYVYNCRSTNAWDMDLALTVTHFPESNLTYAMMFGCPISTENEVIRRLGSITVDVSYPMLLPGIFAELERDRHIRIIEQYMDNIEETILELNYQPSVDRQMHDSSSNSRQRDKKSQWLDTTYLRNDLITWRTQLTKMVKHTNELNDEHWDPQRYANNVVCLQSHVFLDQVDSPAFPSNLPHGSDSPDYHIQSYDKEPNSPSTTETSSTIYELHDLKMSNTGVKVNDRLQDIIEEYDDKIRECTMRIDGMAMATQWFQSHGETNLEIALATGRDSSHMRSIAVVTMIFLPGTFCASVFSMQFFNWISDDDGNTVVSPYLWIYILAAVLSTILTLGAWYFFSWREKRRRLSAQEDVVV